MKKFVLLFLIFSFFNCKVFDFNFNNEKETFCFLLNESRPNFDETEGI